jgi:hypothetical protein
LPSLEADGTGWSRYSGAISADFFDEESMFVEQEFMFANVGMQISSSDGRF